MTVIAGNIHVITDAIICNNLEKMWQKWHENEEKMDNNGLVDQEPKEDRSNARLLLPEKFSSTGAKYTGFI